MGFRLLKGIGKLEVDIFPHLFCDVLYLLLYCQLA